MQDMSIRRFNDLQGDCPQPKLNCPISRPEFFISCLRRRAYVHECLSRWLGSTQSSITLPAIFFFQLCLPLSHTISLSIMCIHIWTLYHTLIHTYRYIKVYSQKQGKTYKHV